MLLCTALFSGIPLHAHPYTEADLCKWMYVGLCTASTLVELCTCGHCRDPTRAWMVPIHHRATVALQSGMQAKHPHHGVMVAFAAVSLNHTMHYIQ